MTIIQFESENFYRAALELMLFNVGEELTDCATNLAQAARVIDKVKAGKLKPDIAVIDTIIQRTHEEGEGIAKQLKEAVPGLKVIAYTIMDEDELPWADHVAIKSSLDPERTMVKALGASLGVDPQKLSGSAS